MQDLGNALGVVVFKLVGASIAILYFGSIVWAYSDAESRGKPGCLVVLLVALLSWPIGLLAWLVFRPNDKQTR